MSSPHQVPSARHGGEPEAFGDAIQALIGGGLLHLAAASDGRDLITPDPQDPIPGLMWGRNRVHDPYTPALVTAEAVEGLPWSDRPRRVIEATDSIDPSERTWDDSAVRTAASEIGRLLGIARPLVEVVDNPREAFERWRVEVQGDEYMAEDGFVSLFYDGPLDTTFGEMGESDIDEFWRSLQPGRRPEDPLRTGLRTRGYALWAYTRFDQIYGGMFSGRYPQQISVAWQVAAYLRLLLLCGGTFVSAHWLPSRRDESRYAVELRIGRRMVDAFVSGAGFLVPVGDRIIVAPRAVLRILPEQPSPLLMPRYHHDAGPAVEFGDGTGVHFLHGVSLPEWLHLAIVEGALTMRHVRLMQDRELRQAAVQSLPPHALLDGVAHEMVDVGTKGTRLHRIDDLPDLRSFEGPAWYMVMTDPSTGREYGEFVPPEVGRAESADGAQAAAWGISIEEYRRMTLEG